MPTLTTRSIEAIKSGPARREIRDKLLPGLYFVVQPSGTRSWAVRYRSGARTRKHTLGTYPALDLKAARDLAREALRAAADGRDPGQEKVQAREAARAEAERKAAREAARKGARAARDADEDEDGEGDTDDAVDTIEAVAKRFFKRYCKLKNRPSTVASTKRMLKTYVLPKWRGRLLSDITRKDVRELIDSVVDAGKPVMANRVLSAVSTMCTWACDDDKEEIIAESPCVGVKAPSAEHSRDRVLNDVELRNVWRAASELGGPYGVMFQLLILTGQRRGEVSGMRWSELDLDAVETVVEAGKKIRKPAPVWRLPAERTKNGKAHDVPLSQAAVDVLKSLPRSGDFVVTASGAIPSGSFSRYKQMIDECLPSNMPGWTVHDLRRTLATGLQKLGIRLEVTEALLNHVSGSRAGVVGVYQRYTWTAEKRVALNAWAQHVLALASGDNVVALHA